MMTPQFNAQMVSQVQQELAEATTFVWKMQNALSEDRRLTEEITGLACALSYRVGIISGMIERWNLMLKNDPDARPDGVPAP